METLDTWKYWLTTKELYLEVLTKRRYIAVAFSKKIVSPTDKRYHYWLDNITKTAAALTGAHTSSRGTLGPVTVGPKGGGYIMVYLKMVHNCGTYDIY